MVIKRYYLYELIYKPLSEQKNEKKKNQLKNAELFANFC